MIHRVTAIVAAAGRGRRLGVNKILYRLFGKPVIFYSLDVLNSHKLIDKIIIAANTSDLEAIKRLVKRYAFRKVCSIVKGGVIRKDSVKNALKFLPAECDLVLIHDAARPFVDSQIISRLIKEAALTKAAIAAVKVKSTIKQVNPKKQIRLTLKRRELVEVQTPQVFSKDLILEAYKNSAGLEATDDSFLVERLGRKVRIVEGSYFNIKITTPEDLVFAKAILERRYKSGYRNTK